MTGIMKNTDHPENPYKLRTCVWEITLACCFSCRYCGSRAGRARQNELTTEECLNVADQLAELGCRRTALIGGEVFMRRDWSVIAKALTDRGISVPIVSNGFLFTDALIGELKQAAIESVAISLDGPEGIHDRFRQEGSFQRAVRAIDELSAGGIPVSVISTLHNRNVDHLDEMFDILAKKRIFAWQLQACSPMGNASSGDFSTAFDFRKAIAFVEKHRNSSDFVIGIADNIGYYTENDGYLRGDPEGQSCFPGCQAGISAIGIDSAGSVRGCESMYDDRFNEGNLREKSLRDIWDDPDAFSYNRHFSVFDLTGKCRGCSHGYRCAGGCRSYNYFSHGRLYECPCCASKQ